MNPTRLKNSIIAMATAAAIAAAASCTSSKAAEPGTPTIAPTGRHWDGKQNRKVGGCRHKTPKAKPGSVQWITPPEAQPTTTTSDTAATIAAADSRTQDQGDMNCCCACASTTALEYAEAADKRPTPSLAAGDLYCRIDNGIDNGADPLDACRELATNGCCDTLHAAAYSYRWPQHTADWQTNQASNRAYTCYTCSTTDSITAELLRGRPVVAGIDVTSNFTPDTLGNIPEPNNEIEGGHAICLVAVQIVAGQARYQLKNSWGEQWGQNGLAWISTSWLHPNKYYCYSIASTIDPAPDKRRSSPKQPRTTTPGSLAQGSTRNPTQPFSQTETHVIIPNGKNDKSRTTTTATTRADQNACPWCNTLTGGCASPAASCGQQPQVTGKHGGGEEASGGGSGGVRVRVGARVSEAALRAHVAMRSRRQRWFRVSEAAWQHAYTWLRERTWQDRRAARHQARAQRRASRRWHVL